MANKCKSCFCDCHCSLKEHSDMDGVCACPQCMCKSVAPLSDEECESCQQTKQNVVRHILKKKKNLGNVASQMNNTRQNKQHTNTQSNQPRRIMNKLFLVLALLFALSACSVGKKCTYTQEGTKISSWIWFTKDMPADLDKNNCN